MMSRDKLRQTKAKLRQGDVGDPTQLLHSLVDSHLEVLDQLEGGKSTQEQRAELKERERQVKLALADLRTALADQGDTGKALYTVDLIEQMLRAKGPDWTREWQWYAPRVEEEFDENIAAH